MSEIYAATIEQAVHAEQLGFETVWFTEHHFLPDGYLPAFQPLAGAIAARTSKIRISTDIAILPLYHPLRLAEEMAVLDNISGGRMELGVGMGYVPIEFEAYGVPFVNRVSMTEEAIEILRLAWADEPFSYSGKRYRIPRVDVHPKPVQPGGPPLWVAAMRRPGALRAARLATNLLPQMSRSESLDPWIEAVKAAGREPGDHRIGIIRSFLVTDDPERDWARIRPAERFRTAVYQELMEATPDDYGRGWAEEDAIPQTVFRGDADACIAELRRFVDTYGFTDIILSGLPPGTDPELMAASLERFATQVMPQLAGG
jgi:alkanesulfonate monooxygenase SsuD/methylene tetrahydromethanopterin reductase-like flavin-dependent oxidoreductase (luciferase family)